MQRHKSEALLRHIDTLIARYKESDELLAQELTCIRVQLVECQRRSAMAEFAQHALRAATWIKFILDHLPPPH